MNPVSLPPLRVALCFGTYPPARNGGSDFVERLAATLACRGHEVHVLTSGDEGSATERGVHVHRLVSDWGSRQCLKRADTALREADVEVVHVLFPDSVVQGRYRLPAVLRLGQAPLVTTWWNLGLGRHSPFPIRLESLALLARSKVLTSHEPVSIGRLRKAAFGRPVAWLPAGSNLVVEGELPPRDALRDVFKLDGNAFWLGYFGQLDPTRGVEDLFAAVATLRSSHDVRLVMIGSAGRPERYRAEPSSGSYLTAMLELPLRLGIADAVRWTDYLADADVVGYLRAIDVCVLPYRRNQIGRSALAAALEVGAPTVLAGSAASVAPLVPGRNVALVPPGSPEVLARTLEGILDDGEARDRLRAGALAGAKYFSWPSIGERAESIYRRAAQA